VVAPVEEPVAQPVAKVFVKRKGDKVYGTKSGILYYDILGVRRLARHFDGDGLPTDIGALEAAADWAELKRLFDAGELIARDRIEVAGALGAADETKGEKIGGIVARLFGEEWEARWAQRGRKLKGVGVIIGPWSGHRWGSFDEIRRFARLCDKDGNSTDPANVTNDAAFNAARYWY
jgi:hypothetical protein